MSILLIQYLNLEKTVAMIEKSFLCFYELRTLTSLAGRCRPTANGHTIPSDASAVKYYLTIH